MEFNAQIAKLVLEILMHKKKYKYTLDFMCDLELFSKILSHYDD